MQSIDRFIQFVATYVPYTGAFSVLAANSLRLWGCCQFHYGCWRARVVVAGMRQASVQAGLRQGCFPGDTDGSTPHRLSGNWNISMALWNTVVTPKRYQCHRCKIKLIKRCYFKYVNFEYNSLVTIPLFTCTCPKRNDGEPRRWCVNTLWRQLPGSVRLHAILYTNIDRISWRNMVTSGVNELTEWACAYRDTVCYYINAFNWIFSENHSICITNGVINGSMI